MDHDEIKPTPEEVVAGEGADAEPSVAAPEETEEKEEGTGDDAAATA